MATVFKDNYPVAILHLAKSCNKVNNFFEIRELDPMPSGLKIREIREGTGAVAARNTRVTIHYRGFLNQGEQFRSSYEEAPVQFVVGKRAVIAGLERGVIGMRVGGCRQFIISPHLAYRDEGVVGCIPPDAVLRFEVELLAVDKVE